MKMIKWLFEDIEIPIPRVLYGCAVVWAFYFIFTAVYDLLLMVGK